MRTQGMGRAAMALLLLLAACDHDTTHPDPVTSSPPATLPTPLPTPNPEPAPTPTPAPPANQPPTVALRGGGSCHPKPGAPCYVSFSVVARDPDGDRLFYSWGGCAQGNGETADCVVSKPGQVSVTVWVGDGHGGSTTASGYAEGANQTPLVTFGVPNKPMPNPVPSHTSYTLVGGEPWDPDQDDDQHND